MRLVEKSDVDEINTWLQARGFEWGFTLENLPAIGFIEPGIAVGFLLQAECKVCFLESYASNPEADKEKRKMALKEMTCAMIDYAKRLGFDRILVFSSQESIIERAQKDHGFTLEPSMQFLSLGV